MQINLFLRVMKRREDGYHDLASLFHVRVPLTSLFALGGPAGLPVLLCSKRVSQGPLGIQHACLHNLLFRHSK